MIRGLDLPAMPWAICEPEQLKDVFVLMAAVFVIASSCTGWLAKMFDDV